MSCKCKDDFETGPQDSCLICAQKHFTTAMRAMNEFGYQDKNRSFAIGELGLALNHVQTDHPQLAAKMRIVRRRIQYHQDPQIGSKWDEICADLDAGIAKELAADQSVPANRPVRDVPVRQAQTAPKKIYIFSNVLYPEENKIAPETDDLLVFLNKAATIDYYAEHKQKIVYHRSPKQDYGKRIEGIRNFYVFNGGPVFGIPRAFIDDLKKSYDWNYEVEKGKVKCMTTGYMVAMWLRQKNPDSEIVLVNFGDQVRKSTYRCPYHNWAFEVEALKDWTHIYLEEQK